MTARTELLLPHCCSKGHKFVKHYGVLFTKLVCSRCGKVVRRV